MSLSLMCHQLLLPAGYHSPAVIHARDEATEIIRLHKTILKYEVS